MAGPDDSGDSYWGDVSVAVDGTVTVHMSETYERTLNYPSIHLISYEWSSYNNSIAQVISYTLNSCTVRGIKKGRVRINFSVLYKVDGAYGSIDKYVSEKGYVMLTVEDPILVGDIWIYPSSIFLAPKEQEQLEAFVYPSNATNQNVSWSTSAPEVVIVSNTGLLTAKGYGTATITCSATDGSGISATCNVTVDDNVPITGITLNDYKGQELTEISLGTIDPKHVILYVKVSPQNATEKSQKITCTSSNPDVVWVSWYGVQDDGNKKYELNAKTEGSAIITCSAVDDSSVKATCLVNVYKYGDGAYLTAKSTEGIDMRFCVSSASNHTCYLSYIERYASGTITIPGEVEGFKVTEIGPAFYNNYNTITKVNLPSTVERIADKAFYGCTSLSSIALDNVKYIGEEAFYGCTSLSDVTGRDNLEYIGGYAFDNTSLYNNMPDGLVYLGKVLYKYKGKIPANTEISVNEGTVSISPKTFSNNSYSSSNLVSITLPKSLSDVSENSLYDCSGLKTIIVADGNETYDSRNNCNAIIETSSNTLVTGCKGTVIPDGVRSIGKQAFYSRSPENILIPNSVERIEDEAFSSCSSIIIGSGLKKIGKDIFTKVDRINISADNPNFDSREDCNAIIETNTNKLIFASNSATIPNTVKAIGRRAFGSAPDIEDIKIHDYLEIIEDSAFINNWHLKRITIGRSVKKIGRHAFVYCGNLKTVHSLLINPPAVDEETFEISYYNIYDCKANLYVPKGTLNNYKTTIGWPVFEKIIEIDDYAIIDGDKFTDETIEGIELTYEVKDCMSKTCELVGSPTTIEGKVTIPETPQGYTVVSIGQSAFDSNKTTEVIIPNSVDSIARYAFFYNYNLRSLTLGKKVRKIGSSAFSYCFNMKTIQALNPNPIEIEESVFKCSADEIYNGATLYVPIGAKTKYMSSAVWKKFKTIIEGEPPVLVTAITLSSTEMTLTAGDTSQLTAEFIPENATNKNVTWSSDNENVVTVSSNGLVTAISKGNANIICKAADEGGVTATCKVTVKALPPSAIYIPSSATVEVGATITLTPTFEPANATANLTWSSDDETIASVNSEGVVTGIKKGYTFIVVETDNGKYADCKVTVIAPEPTNIEIPRSISLYVDQTLKLTPTITPENAETTLAWKSDDETVVTVSDDGILTGVGEGVARVSVSTANGVTSNNCRVKVELDPDGIASVSTVGTKNTIYNLSGQRVATPRKGIYIKGGKKVIVQ